MFQQLWQAYWNPASGPNNNARPAATGRHHVPGSFPGMDYGSSSVQENDRFEPTTANDEDALRLRLAHLRSREENLNDAEAAELCDLNDAQRLQQDYEQGKLADSDVREAVRLASLRKAFATPGFVSKTKTHHQGDQFKKLNEAQRNETQKKETETAEPTEAELLAIRNRLSGLRARRSQLSPEDVADLCDLEDAERIQRAIEQNKLEDRDVAEASRLAPLRKAFEKASKPVKATKISKSHAKSHAKLSKKHQADNNGSHSTNDTGGSSANGTLTHNMPGTPMSMNDLYGRNLARVTIRQGNNNTCYLLSAFDAIFNHPQGRRLLSLIQVNRVRDGYMVRFPGQPEPIHVPKSALKGNNMPTSNQIGVTILWRAFFSTPGAPDPQEFGNATDAMERIFGRDRVASTRDTIDVTLAESSQERNAQANHIDLLTTTRRGGNHYFSIRPNADLSFNLANPRNTNVVHEHLSNQHAIARHYSPELTRIRLDN